MIKREQIEKQEKNNLSLYAIKSQDTKGREYKEKEHPYRTAFQRDKDRIIYSTAFRRLQYKTQVFVNHEGDHYRTRLTHTLEVFQISRTIARALGLNEDLVETIALAHDIGHTPFGHSGEETLNSLMKDHGGFEHNRQALRIVDYLEKRYPGFRGLNLTWETREGIIKHTTKYDTPEVNSFSDYTYPSLEAQVVNAADEIAYNNHDLEDGITSHLITFKNLSKVELFKNAKDNIDQQYPKASKKVRRCLVIRELINQYVTDLLNETRKKIEKYNITSPDEARAHDGTIVDFSESFNKKKDQLSEFLFNNLYRHPRVIRMSDKADRFIKQLFDVYIHNTNLLPTDKQSMIKKDTMHTVICDYIAGMTDRFALNEYKKLFQPYEKV
jgi:dGTPase